MKKVFSNSELVHIYASQNQSEGRNSKDTMYFIDKEFYSYGSHFCVSNILDNQNVLINSNTYSPTTGKHISQVRYALNHLNTFSVPNPAIPASKENLDYCVNEFNEYMKKHLRARVYNYLHQLNSMVKTYEFLFENIHTSDHSLKPALSKMWETLQTLARNPEDLKKSLKLEDKKIKDKKKADELERIETNKKIIVQWKNGIRSDIPWGIYTAYLRISQDNKSVETSKGVKVSIESAHKLCQAIESGIDIIGHDIEGFTVISINGTLKIGCHDIPISEVQEITAKIKSIITTNEILNLIGVN